MFLTMTRLGLVWRLLLPCLLVHPLDSLLLHAVYIRLSVYVAPHCTVHTSWCTRFHVMMRSCSSCKLGPRVATRACCSCTGAADGCLEAASLHRCSQCCSKALTRASEASSGVAVVVVAGCFGDGGGVSLAWRWMVPAAAAAAADGGGGGGEGGEPEAEEDGDGGQVTGGIAVVLAWWS